MNFWPAHETAARLEWRGVDQAALQTSRYRRVNQEGSHVILETDSPRHHRLAVPDHNPLRIGTLNAILRAVAEVKGLQKEDILNPR
jgi:predicted RNA binding protein YcfA (HicA-like mRNA interferase family)